MLLSKPCLAVLQILPNLTSYIRLSLLIYSTLSTDFSASHIVSLFTHPCSTFTSQLNGLTNLSLLISKKIVSLSRSYSVRNIPNTDPSL